MIKIVLALSFSLLLFASNNLLYGNQTHEKDTIKYSVQISTINTQQQAKNIERKVPKSLRKDLHLYKIGKYIVLRYAITKHRNKLRVAVKKFQKLGFSDAFIIKTSQWNIHKTMMDVRQEKASTTQVIQTKHTLNRYTKSEMIEKADKAYKSGDESTAMIYYEMIANSGSATRNVKNNLCYLYGKHGAWYEAKKIIDEAKYPSKLLYAYAYGAVQTNQDNFAINFATSIILDKSGRLALLAGYYFEQREDWDRAERYYKMSYKKNPSDIYNIFAYARVLDIKGQTKKALKLYKKIMRSANRHTKYYTAVQRRISQL